MFQFLPIDNTAYNENDQFDNNQVTVFELL